MFYVWQCSQRMGLAGMLHGWPQLKTRMPKRRAHLIESARQKWNVEARWMLAGHISLGNVE